MNKDTYRKMGEINKSPGHTGSTIGDGDEDEPGEEKKGDVGGPYTRICEPLCVTVQIRRRHHFHIHLLFSDSIRLAWLGLACVIDFFRSPQTKEEEEDEEKYVCICLLRVIVSIRLGKF